MLLDRFMPVYEVRSRHDIEVDADADRVYRQMRDTDIARPLTVRMLFLLRGLPRSRPLTLDRLVDSGFVLLGEEPGSEVVLGVTGLFWKASGRLRRIGPDEFPSFSEPGHVKAAWSLRVEPGPEGGSVLSTETRVITTDEGSRRAFGRYWRVVGPFSGIIRGRILAQVKKAAEAAAGTV
jgi:hypothetical protein